MRFEPSNFGTDIDQILHYLRPPVFLVETSERHDGAEYSSQLQRYGRLTETLVSADGRRWREKGEDATSNRQGREPLLGLL